MKHLSVVRAAILGLALAAMGTASAGSKFTGSGSVVIAKNADGAGAATGIFGHIYNGTGVNEFIGCQKSSTGGLYCQARNEALVHVACSTNSVYLGNAVGTLSPDARVTFRFNANGACTSITIIHSSEYQDKQG